MPASQATRNYAIRPPPVSAVHHSSFGASRSDNREYLVPLAGACGSDAPQNSQAGARIPVRQKCINGDGFGNRLGIRAGIRGLHGHRRWNDLRIFADGQSPHRDQPDEEDDRKHARENRTADEENVRIPSPFGRFASLEDFAGIRIETIVKRFNSAAVREAFFIRKLKLNRNCLIAPAFRSSASALNFQQRGFNYIRVKIDRTHGPELRPLSKAESTLAATARTPRRKIGFRNSDLVSLISLIHGPSMAQATLAKEAVSSPISAFSETASPAIASSARSGRNRCGNGVCQAATSASSIAFRIRDPSPGKRRSYWACSRTFKSASAAINLPQKTTGESGSAQLGIINNPFIILNSSCVYLTGRLLIRQKMMVYAGNPTFPAPRRSRAPG
jgi:hypothetical protein